MVIKDTIIYLIFGVVLILILSFLVPTVQNNGSILSTVIAEGMEKCWELPNSEENDCYERLALSLSREYSFPSITNALAAVETEQAVFAKFENTQLQAA